MRTCPTSWWSGRKRALSRILICFSLQEMDLALGTYVTDNPSRQHEWLFVLHRNLPNTYVQVIQEVVSIFRA